MKKIQLLTILSGHLLCFAQGDLQIVLKDREGYGPFRPGELTTLPMKKRPEARNIPGSILEYTIRQIDFQPYNSEFKEYASKGMTREVFLSQFDKINKTLLTEKAYRHTFNVLLGKTTDKKIIVIIDVNNNLKFDDDKQYIFPVLTQKEEELATGHPTSVVLPFEFYDGKAVIERPAKIIINPYKRGLQVTLLDSIENRFFLASSIPSYKEGRCMLLNKPYNVYLCNQYRSQDYSSANSRLLLSPESEPPAMEIQGNIPFEQDDIINIEGNQYRFSSVSLFGDTITLKYIGYNQRPEGFLENMYVPGFKARTIYGEDFDLSRFRDKYILLDFWGTWCVPCIKSLPEIKALHEKFKDKNFVLVSVANDRDIDKVKMFVEKNEMSWVNVFQDEMAGHHDSELLKKLKISQYPTMILIDPNGKIVCRDKGIAYIEDVLTGKLKSVRDPSK
ncbi:MAG TPA: TlpA disulfide reductase family protein [Puia sp.]